jgi:hypothetical protein
MVHQHMQETFMQLGHTLSMQVFYHSLQPNECDCLLFSGRGSISVGAEGKRGEGAWASFTV